MPDRSDQPADKSRTRPLGDPAVRIMRELVEVQALVRSEGWDRDAAQLGALAAAVDTALGLAEQWAEVKARHEGVVCRIGERCPTRRAQLKKGGPGDAAGAPARAEAPRRASVRRLPEGVAAHLDSRSTARSTTRRLHHAVRNGGVTAQQLDAAMCNGPALTALVRGVPNPPHREIGYRAAYEGCRS